MTTWFKASGWSYTPEIKPVEAVKVTEKFITYAYKSWDGKPFENRVAKESGSEAFFQTWEEARAYLLGKVTIRVESMRQQLERSNGALGNVKGMKPPVT